MLIKRRIAGGLLKIFCAIDWIDYPDNFIACIQDIDIFWIAGNCFFTDH